MADPASTGEDELALVGRVRAGERESFHVLVSRYERSLYRAAMAITHNPADAEEVVQETFLRAYEHLDQFRAEAKFHTWLTQIALNTARMKRRKGHAGLWESLDEPRNTEDGQLPRDVAEWRENPEQRLGRTEIETLLHHALGGMPPGYRDVLVLRDLQQLSTQETAEALGLSIPNVKTRLLRARILLRERMGTYLHPRAAGAAEVPAPGSHGSNPSAERPVPLHGLRPEHPSGVSSTHGGHAASRGAREC